MRKKVKKFNIFFKGTLLVNSNYCLKNLFLLVTIIIFTIIGCERNKPPENSQFKKKSINKSENYQEEKTKVKDKKKSWAKSGGKGSKKKKNNVRLTKVEPSSFSVTKTYVGYLLPNNRVLMRSEIDGVIEKIYFEEGNKIVKEKRMIEISTKELQLKMNIAIANANLAKINIERDEKLAEKNLISNAQLDQSRTQSESANLNKELAKINLKKSLISSPLNGTIKTRFVKIGEFVRKGDKLAEILDLSRVIVKINIPEQDILDIKIGQEVSIALYILEDTNFLGKVKNIGLEADSNNRTFPVEIDVDNLKRKLRPGMLARATFTKKISENQIVIPRHTILEKEEGRVVYVFEKGKVLQRYIEVGLTKQDQVQILNGLKNGEMIVVEGHTKLSDGEDVNVVK